MTPSRPAPGHGRSRRAIKLWTRRGLTERETPPRHWLENGVNMEIRAFAIEAVEHIQPSRVPGTVMVGGVCVRGLDELEPSAWPGNLSFVDRWRDAMCLCIGTEEFEKYCSQSKKPWR